MPSRFLAFLDSSFLSRLGNFQQATRLAVLIAVLIAALVFGIVELVSQIQTVWLVIAGFAFAGLLFEGLRVAFRAISSRRVVGASDALLSREATELASAVAAILADHARYEPDTGWPTAQQFEDQEASRRGFDEAGRLRREHERRALARYIEAHQSQVFAVANELGHRAALTENQVRQIVSAGQTIHWMGEVPGLLLLGARQLRLTDDSGS